MSDSESKLTDELVTKLADVLWGDGAILDEVWEERLAQLRKWGEQNHKDGTSVLNKSLADDARRRRNMYNRMGHLSWSLILEEEVAEAMAEEDPVKLREELIKVAASAAAWVEAIDRRTK